ncbi:S-adenosyl-L-methionine-dependent methyltransferase [Wilcoxina mikolae CBS 423.85]|nr:S-adenosyl-L-methionine-dependent methyltransferase [Wilcoxina mikolae CBS 423.85]
MTDNTQYEAAIEVDPAVLADEGVDDYKSSGYETSTESLSSTVNEYVFENGRRYHAYFGVDKNLMPTDEKEQNRCEMLRIDGTWLDMHHEIMLGIVGGKLHVAPVEDPQRILDIGTGTGIWAIDMADKYPSAEVIGTDLSPIQPSWVPPNCKFEVDDVEKEWTYQENSFDFIQSRNLAQAIENWPKLMSQIYRCTKPGGYCEIAELGLTLYSDDNTKGNNFQRLYRCTDCHRKATFGPWPKDKRMKSAGAMVMLNAETGSEAYGMAPFTRILGMSIEEATKTCRDAYTDIENKNYHMYTPFYLAYGRKPSS